MKLMCVLLFLSNMFNFVYAQTNEDELKEITLEGEEYTLDASIEANIVRQNNQRQVDLYNLQKAKFKMISGDLKLAEFFLNRISEQESLVTAIKKRYLAMIYFIDGRFDKSLKELDDKRVNRIEYTTQNCLLRLINFMAVNDVAAINREKKLCQVLTLKYSKNEQFWLDTMIKLKTQDLKGIKKNMMIEGEHAIGNSEMSRLWLKTGLFINQEKELLQLIALLPESSYQSKKLREIIAFMYLRSGEDQKALAFVDDIDSANAENIKGNIKLKNKEYELAFGHFRLALQKKQDSNNALERAIPLSWLLNQWNDGLVMLNNISNKNLDPRNTQAIKIAFLIREKRFVEAKKELILLKNAFKNQPPSEVNIMDSYINLVSSIKDRVENKRNAEEAAEKSCKSFDGISCWIALQHIQWENLGMTIKRDDATFTDNNLSIESLKEKKAAEPLIETKSLDQADIEELDGESITISPQ